MADAATSAHLDQEDAECPDVGLLSEDEFWRLYSVLYLGKVFRTCVVDVATHRHGGLGLCRNHLGSRVAKVGQDRAQNFCFLVLAKQHMARVKVAVGQLLRMSLFQSDGDLSEPGQKHVVGWLLVM